MIRNTSPVGWVPLLAWKVLFENSLLPFLKSALLVAIPIIFFCIWVDTTFYQSETWVVTSYNFLEMNVLLGLSKYFGEDGPLYYLIAGIPAIFVLLSGPALVSTFTHIKYKRDLNQVPYIAYYTLFYLLFFSLIAHKEVRFLLPVFPFVMIMSAEMLHNTAFKQKPGLTAFYVWFYIFVEVIVFFVLTLNHERGSNIYLDLLREDPNMHSVYSTDVYNTPRYSLLHR